MTKDEAMVLPSVVWRHVASLLDLASQAALAATCRDLMDIVVSLWRRHLLLISDQIKTIGQSYKQVKQAIVMEALLEELGPVGKMDPYLLHSLLARFKFLSFTSLHHNSGRYEYFHDYGRQKRKHLELHQKWPRPGSKSLTQFVAGNSDLICLEVSDCRENIEAVHFIMAQCTRLQALRLFATDPLLPYSEIANLAHLKFLEIQFDTFYREHRDEFLHGLGQLQNLQVLKIPTCFGLTDSQASSLISCCTSLTHLTLPCNSKIAGWVLETLVQFDSPTSFGSHLKSLSLTVNTAYVPLTSCIPEPLATVLVEEAKTTLNANVTIAFTHKKLPSFNPKGFCDSDDCSF